MSKIKYFISQSWLLIAASFCFGLLIAIANAAWAPRIEQNQIAKLNDLMKNLITNAQNFPSVAQNAQITTAKGKPATTDIYKATDSQNNIVGFAFVAAGPGFTDIIKLVIAVDKNCEKFLGFNVLASNETPGFGSKITGDYFADQFKNAPAQKFSLDKTGSYEQIDENIIAISGATVSSQGVVNIFNNYTDGVKEYLKQEGLLQNGK
jgi:electron transport complex protein RnfG